MWHCDGYDKLKPYGFAIYTRMYRWVSVVYNIDYSHYMEMSCDDLVMFYIGTQEGSYGWKLGHLTMTPELCLVTT